MKKKKVFKLIAKIKLKIFKISMGIDYGKMSTTEILSEEYRILMHQHTITVLLNQHI